MYSDFNTINNTPSDKEHLEIGYKIAQGLLDMNPTHQNEILKLISEIVRDSRVKRIEILKAELSQLTQSYKDAFGDITPQ